MKFSILFCIFLFIFFGCELDSPRSNKDIYNYCKKNETLKYELFKKVNNINMQGKLIYLVIDIAGIDAENYDKHLIVCNKSMIVKGATGLVPDSLVIKGDTIYGVYGDTYMTKKRHKTYRDDLPKNYIFKLKKRDTYWNGHGRNPENSKILDSIKIINNDLYCRLYVRGSKNTPLYIFSSYLDNKKYYDSLLNKTEKTEIIELPLNKLFIDKSRAHIYTIDSCRNYSNNTNYNEFYPANKKIIDKLVIDVWNILKKNKN